jgi:hypothetical protein
MNYATSILLENWSSEGDIVERTIGRSIKETEEAFLAIGAPAQAGGFLSAASGSEEINLL